MATEQVSHGLRAIRKTRLYEEVVLQLADLIQEGRLRPGDRLPAERDLAERFQVSRASVREAMRTLELQGLVVSRPGLGTFVADESVDGVLQSLARELLAGRGALEDIFELRLLLEPLMAFLAAQRASPEDQAFMESILKEQERLVDLGESGASADVAFHTALARSTHNQAMVRLSGTLVDLLAPSREESLQTPQRSGQSLKSHRAILRVIEQGEAEEARRAMEQHIARVDRALLDGDDLPARREGASQFLNGG